MQRLCGNEFGQLCFAPGKSGAKRAAAAFFVGAATRLKRLTRRRIFVTIVLLRVQNARKEREMAEEKQELASAAETSGQEFASGADIGGQHKRGGFTSKIGFVLAAAGSAVGLGNLWRFPYLAAKYGGGMFLLCYVLLAVTFGFSLLVLEIAIGRKTGKGVIGAFASLNKKFKWFGFICLVVPIIIIPYYSVIGGWVVRYIVAFLEGNGQLLGEAANAETSAEFFSSFTANPWQPLVYFLIFGLATILVVVFGVQKGIERISKILMPALAILALFLMIYVLCQPGALAGVKKLFVPDFGDFTYETLLAALGQLFYSMSLAMCIMITYGSYMKKEASITASARQISICDTVVDVRSASGGVQQHSGRKMDRRGVLCARILCGIDVVDIACRGDCFGAARKLQTQEIAGMRYSVRHNVSARHIVLARFRSARHDTDRRQEFARYLRLCVQQHIDAARRDRHVRNRRLLL